MIRGMVMRAFRQLQRERDPAHRLILAERLRETLPRARLLPPQRREVIETLRSLNLDVPEEEPNQLLRIGEAWLPLYGDQRCDVGVLRVRSAGPAGTIDTALGQDARDQLRLVRDVVIERLAQQGVRPRRVVDRGYVVDLETEVAEPSGGVDGPSLGLAFAVAMLSLELQRAVHTDTAGSAEIGREGRLKAVGHIAEKIRVLHEQHPEVRRLVVAKSQDRPSEPLPDGIAWVAVESIEEGWEAFGLRIAGAEMLRRLEIGDIRAKLAGFEEAVEPGYPKEAWSKRALEAWAVATAAAALPNGGTSRTRALGFAGLFSLHAGDEKAACRYLEPIGESDVAGLRPPARVWIRMIRATAAIDAGAEDAISLAEIGVREAESLLVGEDRDLLLGRAYGTLGRAFVHAGRAGEKAVEWLRKGADHHARHCKDQHPRSLTYLAMGLRQAGRPKEALEEAVHALDLCCASSDTTEVANARMFLLLETGRARRDLGDLVGAATDLEECCTMQERDDDYPRVGALRSLVGTYADLGEHERADDCLRRCIAVACDLPDRDDDAIIAACGGAEALLRGTPWAWSIARDAVEREWRRHHGRGCEPADLRDGLSRCVY